jgi:hypothetical protein
MQNSLFASILTTSEINEILQNVNVQMNKENLSTNNLVNFAISLPNEIKSKLENTLSIHLLDTVPMRWIKGDTLPHIDKGQEEFENTYLIYLTDSNGSLIIDGTEYPIVAGNAHVFNEGLQHSTINATNERLMIGPISENGLMVGAVNTIYYFLNQTDAQNALRNGSPMDHFQRPLQRPQPSGPLRRHPQQQSLHGNHPQYQRRRNRRLQPRLRHPRKPPPPGRFHRSRQAPRHHPHGRPRPR